MAFQLELLRDLQIVHVLARCLLSQEDRKAILIGSALEMSRTGFFRLLIDVTETEFSADEPMTGALALSSFLKTLPLSSHTRIAFLYREAADHRKYFENVAELEGFKLKYFMRHDEAVSWLCRDG